MTFAEVERALVALEERGARGFDRAGCELVRALLARGAALPRPADDLVLERARAHLARLRERFESAAAETCERLARVEERCGPLAEQRTALTRGELRSVRRELRRAALERGSRRPVIELRERQRCAREYAAALSELSAHVTVARAVDDVPTHAGPYNPLRIATDLLARIGAVSPTYLTAQLQRLEEWAVMLTLPELPPSPSTAPAKKPRATGKRRNARRP